MENNQTVPAPTLPDPNVKKPSSALKIVAIVFCFIFGVFQIILSVLLLLLVIPQMQILQHSMGSPYQINFYFVYASLLFTTFLGLLNMFFGFRLIKKPTVLKLALIVLLATFITQGIVTGVVISTVLIPIYSSVAELDKTQSSNSPAPVQKQIATSTSDLTQDPTVNWNTYKNTTLPLFEFKYPPFLWEQRNPVENSIGEYDLFIKNENNSVWFGATSYTPKDNIEDGFLNKENKKTVIYSGYKGILLETGKPNDQYNMDVLLYDNSSKNLAGIYYHALTKEGYEKHIKDFEQILSTFKFTSSAQTPTSKESNISAETNNFPVYPNASFVKKEIVPPCKQPYSGYALCNATTYTWQVADNAFKVYVWYQNNNSGWKVTGGAGAIDKVSGGSGVSSYQKGNLSYNLHFLGNPSPTTITLEIPLGPKEGN